MKKRTLSLALALILTLALIPAAFAAGTTEVFTVTRSGPYAESDVTITNVTSKSTEFVKNWHEDADIEVDRWGDVKTYYCDAPAEIDGAVVMTWNAGVSEDDIESLGYDSFRLKKEGIYLFGRTFWGTEEGIGTDYGFYVVVGGTAPAPAPAPTPVTPNPVPATPVPVPSTPTPVPNNPAPMPATPAPTTPATGSTVALKTTDGLVSVIPPTPAKDKDLAYTVQKGETLWGIAYNYYGSMGKATTDKIYAANAEYFKKTKGILEAGAVITLPAKGLINPVTQGSLDKAAGVYLVKKGDTLADIAKTYYGDSKQWKKIYEANKDRVKLVGGSPMIYEKQWLVIPE